MINAAIPLAIGTAVRLLFQPPAGTKRVVILRKGADTFTGYNDVNALVVLDGIGFESTTDAKSLANGQTYYYKEYDFDGTAWTSSATASATPASTYRDVSTDALEFVRVRLEDGLRAVLSGPKPPFKHDNNYIPVYSAPPLYENVKWPAVSVQLADDSSRGGRFIGEDMTEDYLDPETNTFQNTEGWLSSVQLLVIGWSTNPDERSALRRAIKAIIIGNLPVFDDAGFQQVDFSQSNQEDYDNYSSPVYQTVGHFSCLAPSVITYPDGIPIRDVTVEADADTGS